MARSDQTPDQLTAQNGRRKFVQQIAIAGSGALTALLDVDVYGVVIPQGAKFVLQADQDFNYELRNAAASVSAVTVQSGARPGTLVKALDEHKVIRHSDGSTWGKDTQIDVIGASGTGTLNIYVIS